MNPNGTIKKLIQVTEESLTPLHIPVVLNNECLVITQQDVRKVEETRLFSFSKLLANGELSPLDPAVQDNATREALINACKYYMQVGANNCSNLNDILANARKAEQIADFELALNGPKIGRDIEIPAQSMSNNNNNILEMLAKLANERGITVAAPKATVEQQMQWAKKCNDTSSPFPFTSTKGTSTEKQDYEGQSCHNYCPHCFRSNHINSNANNTPKLCNRGVNTTDIDEDEVAEKSNKKSAPEQLKKRKMKYCFC